MFGHQDDNGQADQPVQPQDNQTDQPLAPDPAGQVVHPDEAQAQPADDQAFGPAPPQPTDESPWQHPGTPLNDTPAPVAPEPPAPITDIGPASGPVSAPDL